MNKLQPIESILPTEEFTQLNEIKEEIEDAWHKNQIFRTDTEARYAVLNDFKFPTKASKYWQSVREQMVHFNELTTLSFDIRRKEIDLRENEEKRASASGFELDRLNVDRDELLYSLASAKRVAKDRVREVMQWSEIKKEVNDGSFDDKNVNSHQKESLFRSVLNRAQVAPKDISAEERLSIDGILHMLKDAPENKELVDNLTKKDKNNE
jgi:hypothetical protein